MAWYCASSSPDAPVRLASTLTLATELPVAPKVMRPLIVPVVWAKPMSSAVLVMGVPSEHLSSTVTWYS